MRPFFITIISLNVSSLIMDRQKVKIRKKLILEGVISVIIVITPIITYLYKYVPSGKMGLDLLFFDVGSHGFDDVSSFLYYFLAKVVPLLLLVIWFVTSKQWWYHAILIPMSMYAFQLFSVITFESSIIDENEILYVVGISMIITPVVYFIRLKLVDKYVHGIDLKAMETELDLLKQKQDLEKQLEELERKKEALAKKM